MKKIKLPIYNIVIKLSKPDKGGGYRKVSIKSDLERICGAKGELIENSIMAHARMGIDVTTSTFLNIIEFCVKNYKEKEKVC